jgi:hypothetical protein
VIGTYDEIAESSSRYRGRASRIRCRSPCRATPTLRAILAELKRP